MADEPNKRPFRVLSLDGGGAKGFYSLGVLAEVEGLVRQPLHKHFDLVFGTSTGAIIAALICLGKSVAEISDLYESRVVEVARQKEPWQKSAALECLSSVVFEDKTFDQVLTGIGVVATRWVGGRPMIFKGSIAQAHGRKGTFVPGFGVTVGDAVVASCAAYPFVNRKVVHTANNDDVELVDGGYCANNPTLYAIADALRALGEARDNLRVLSVGVGAYPEPKRSIFSKMRWYKRLKSVQLLQKTFEINTESMDQLRHILFGDILTERVSDTFEQPEMACDLFEGDLSKLNLLRQRGRQSFADREAAITKLLE